MIGLMAFTADELREMIDTVTEIAVNKTLAKLNFPIGGLTEVATDKPVTGKELCAFIGITMPTLIRYRKKGLVPSKKIGKKILYDKAQVMEAINNKKNR
jgi:hypothetical protein